MHSRSLALKFACALISRPECHRLMVENLYLSKYIPEMPSTLTTRPTKVYIVFQKQITIFEIFAEIWLTEQNAIAVVILTLGTMLCLQWISKSARVHMRSHSCGSMKLLKRKKCTCGMVLRHEKNRPSPHRCPKCVLYQIKLAITSRIHGNVILKQFFLSAKRLFLLNRLNNTKTNYAAIKIHFDPGLLKIIMSTYFGAAQTYTLYARIILHANRFELYFTIEWTQVVTTQFRADINVFCNCRMTFTVRINVDGVAKHMFVRSGFFQINLVFSKVFSSHQGKVALEIFRFLYIFPPNRGGSRNKFHFYSYSMVNHSK